MNWLLPKYYNNKEYKTIKYKNCGIEIIQIQNIRSKDRISIEINLDHSIHQCEGNMNQRNGVVTDYD
ncbi:MAG: hypothetical protein ACR2F1_02185 [Nitrososphaeraceae archaeon]